MAMSIISLSGGPLGAEAVSVLDRAGADAARERASQGLGRAEAGGAGHVDRAEGRRLQQTTCDFDAHLFDVRGGRSADFVTELPREVSLAHRHTRRESFDGVVLL